MSWSQDRNYQKQKKNKKRACSLRIGYYLVLRYRVAVERVQTKRFPEYLIISAIEEILDKIRNRKSILRLRRPVNIVRHSASR